MSRYGKELQDCRRSVAEDLSDAEEADASWDEPGESIPLETLTSELTQDP